MDFKYGHHVLDPPFPSVPQFLDPVFASVTIFQTHTINKYLFSELMSFATMITAEPILLFSLAEA